MYQSTLETQCTEKLNEDIGKFLPRFKLDFKGVESFALKSSHDLEKFAGADDGQAVIRAVAVKLEANFESTMSCATGIPSLSRTTATARGRG